MSAQGQMVDLVGFGARGLWTSAKQRILPMEYCTAATNLRLAASGTLTLRKGWSDQTTTPVSGKDIEQLHEFIKADESTEIISSWDGGIGSGITNPSGNDISGSVTDTSGDWFFQNFNDKCIGFQTGKKLIVYTGTGSFATVTESSGTAPDGGVGCAAYGRIWQVDGDGSTIQYSGLLDETDWGTASAGSIDMNNIWTDGQDTVKAIRGFNGALVVWGKRHVVFFADAQGSSIGLNPANIYVQDVIAGTGCIDQNSVQLLGEQDILFCSFRGIQSLGRLIQEKSNPIDTLTHKVEQDILDSITAVTTGNSAVRSAYNVAEGFYLLSFPSRGECWVLEVRWPYQDEMGGTRMPVFKWGLTAYALLYRDNTDMLLGQNTVIGKYDAYLDDTADISWEYQSPWLDFGEEFNNRLKLLKRIGMIVRTAWSGDILVKWSTDFGNYDKSQVFTLESLGAGAEFGLAKFNEDEFAGSVPLQQFKKAGRDKGQYYRFFLSANTNQELSLQQLEFFYKIGRLA